MRKIAYDSSLDDTEWRETNFSESELQAAFNSNAKQPTVDELIAAAQKYGVDGILESAILLPQFDYQRVARALAKMKGGK